MHLIKSWLLLAVLIALSAYLVQHLDGNMFKAGMFLVKGLREFCKSGYEHAAKSFDKAALDVDVSNQVFLITGANSGIGKCVALAVAQRGGTVHMVCRNQTRGEDAKREITEATGNENVHLHILDLSDSQKVSDFAHEFARSGKTLNVLINNAGCMVNDRQTTPTGYEVNFATNTLGTYILTTRLVPVMQNSENARVITVSSGGMYTQKLRVKDLQSLNVDPFEGTAVYAHQKRQQVIMTEQWAKRHPEIKFFSMHPGWADTPAVQTSMPDFHARLKNRLRSPEQGADTVVWLGIAAAALEEKSGGFYLDRKAQSKHLPLAFTQASSQDEAKLMTTLEEMAAKF